MTGAVCPPPTHTQITCHRVDCLSDLLFRSLSLIVSASEMPPPLLSLSLIAGLAVAMFVSIIVVSVIVAFVVKKK